MRSPQGLSGNCPKNGVEIQVFPRPNRPPEVELEQGFGIGGRGRNPSQDPGPEVGTYDGEHSIADSPEWPEFFEEYGVV